MKSRVVEKCGVEAVKPCHLRHRGLVSAEQPDAVRLTQLQVCASLAYSLGFGNTSFIQLQTDWCTQKMRLSHFLSAI